MQHRIQRPFDVDVVGDVLKYEGKAAIAGQMGDVIRVAGDQVVHSDDGVAICQQPVAQVRSDKAGAAGDEYAHTENLLSGM